MTRIFWALLTLLMLFVGAPAHAAAPPAMAEIRAQSPLEPATPQGVSLTFTGDDAEDRLFDYLSAHQAVCESLGAGRCRVTAATSRDDERTSATLSVLLSPLAMDSFLQRLTKVSVSDGVSVRVNDQRNNRNGRSAEQIAVERRMYEVQRDTLRTMENTEDAAMRAAVRRQLQSIEAQLARLDDEASQTQASQSAVSLEISYSTETSYRSSLWQRELEQLFQMFLISLLAVLGIAILSAVYFGVLGFLLLKLRRLAIRLGLLKGDPKPATSASEIARKAD